MSPLYEVLKSGKYQKSLVLVGKAVRQNTLINHLKRNGILTNLPVEDKAAVHCKHHLTVDELKQNAKRMRNSVCNG